MVATAPATGRRQSSGWTKAGAGVAALAVMVGVDTWIITRLGVGPGSALALSLVIYALLFACLIPATRWAFTRTFPVRAVRRWTPIAVCAWLSTRSVIVWLSLPLFDLPLAAGVSFAVLFGIAAWPRMRRAVASFVAAWVRLPLGVNDPRDAEAMIDACRESLTERDLPPPAARRIRVNLAVALVARSTLRGSADGLIEAARLLDGVASDRDADPALVAEAAEQLATAMTVRERKHGGDRRAFQQAMLLWSGAVRLQGDRHTADAIEQFGRAVADAQADPQERDPGVAVHRRQVTLDRVREAWRLAAPGSSVRDEIGQYLALILSTGLATTAELDESIELSRDIYVRSLARAAGLRGLKRRLATIWTADVADGLAESLYQRALLRPEGAEKDTVGALVLWGSALDRDPPYPAAAFGVARVLRLRASLGMSVGFRLPNGRPLPDIPTAFRLAVEGWGMIADDGALLAAQAWADWAMEDGSVDDAAEALWHVVLVTCSDVFRQLDRQDREEVLASSQGAATEAGYWLTRAGRPREAAVAVEYGRAILASGPAGVDVHEQTRAVEMIHRGQYRDDGRTTAGPGPGFVSPEQLAWQGYDNLLRQMGPPGGGDRGTPSYEALREVVGSDLVVYVGAAERGGYALAVRGDWDEPLTVPLPELTAAEVVRWCEQAATARQPGSPAWPWTLDQLLAWLGTAFAGPLTVALAPDRELTLVPLGLLGLLPLHAALGGEVNHAPNARIRAAARARAARPAGAASRVLVVAAAAVPGWPYLPWAAQEARDVAAAYGHAALPLADATRAEVRQGMAGSAVWHFSCHGLARLDEPLDSALVLADGPLTLREVLASPPSPRRLAVLSACETNSPDLDLLDEVVSLPGGLLRAGVAGVVSSQWQVRDDAALFLMVRFHALFLQGWPPARALAAAQGWLRTVTNGELRAEYPHLVAEPAGFGPDDLYAWRGLRRFERSYYWAAFTFTGA